jgi:hypothetical protein
LIQTASKPIAGAIEPLDGRIYTRRRRNGLAYSGNEGPAGGGMKIASVPGIESGGAAG